MKWLAGLVVAAALIAPPATAEESLSDVQLHQMAQEVCAVPADGAYCEQIRDFPGSDRCGLTLNAETIYQHDPQIYLGRFTADEPQALLQYAYDACESHANNGGGSILFRVDGPNFKFLSYHPGLVFDDCVVASLQSRQRLFCLTSYVGQGEADSSFVEVDLSAKAGTELTAWLTGSSYDGAFGVDVAPCSGVQPNFDRIDAIDIGTKPSEIVVEGDAFRPEAVAAACDRMAKKDLTDDERQIFESNPDFLKDYGILRGEEAEGRKVIVRFELPDKTPHIEYPQTPAKP